MICYSCELERTTCEIHSLCEECEDEINARKPQPHYECFAKPTMKSLVGLLKERATNDR